MLPRRVPGYRPADLDALCASGERRLGRRRARSGRASTSATTRALLGPPAAEAAAGGRRACVAIRAALGAAARSSGPTCSSATGLEPERRARGALGPRLGGRGDERLLGAAACRAALRGAAAASGRRRRFVRSRTAAPSPTQGRWSFAAALFAGDARPAGARRAPARAAGDRDARRRARRGNPRRLRRGVRGAARARDARGLPARATSWRASAARSSRCPGAVERLRELRGRRRTSRPRRSCSPRPIRPSRTAPRCRGRGARARARRASRARWVVLLDGEAALFVERGGRSLVPLRDPDAEWLRPALAALVAHVRAAAQSGSRSSASTATPVVETEAMACSSRPASSPARAAPSCGRR